MDTQIARALEKHKIKLMVEKEDSRLTFDDVINTMLDKLGERPS